MNTDPTADLVQGIKVIDVDTHLSEPLDLWTSRATPKYRDRVPQMRACLYPRPLERVRKCLAELTAEERRKVLSTNAARVYGIPLA